MQAFFILLVLNIYIYKYFIWLFNILFHISLCLNYIPIEPTSIRVDENATVHAVTYEKLSLTLSLAAMFLEIVSAFLKIHTTHLHMTYSFPGFLQKEPNEPLCT